MSKERTETHECPNCGHNFLTYRGFVRFKDDQIVYAIGDWHCSECKKTGKFDVGDEAYSE